MKLPEKVKVAGFDISIVEWDHHVASAAARFGEFSCLEQNIKIDKTLGKQKLLDTFLHEINHAIYWAYGMQDEDKEERIVSTFATAWQQIFRDNPEVIAFVSEAA